MSENCLSLSIHCKYYIVFLILNCDDIPSSAKACASGGVVGEVGGVQVDWEWDGWLLRCAGFFERVGLGNRLGAWCR